MQSSLIGKIEKARVYAQERFRMTVENLEVTFRGENSDHRVSLAGGKWHCTCDFFGQWSVCSHTMALERILEGMVPRQELPALVKA
jgi:hypothetical protein